LKIENVQALLHPQGAKHRPAKHSRILAFKHSRIVIKALNHCNIESLNRSWHNIVNINTEMTINLVH